MRRKRLCLDSSSRKNRLTCNAISVTMCAKECDRYGKNRDFESSRKSDCEAACRECPQTTWHSDGTAMDMYLNQIALVGGIPFPVTLPRVPQSVNADSMTDEELLAKLNRGIEDANAGRTRHAAEAFHEHRSRRAE